MEIVTKTGTEKLKVTEHLTASSFTEQKDSKMLCDLSDKEIERRAKITFNSIAMSKIPNYTILNENKTAINDIFTYFHGNTGNLNLNKGIYMFGNFGCGKTSLFGLFSKYLSMYFPFSENGFGNASIEEVIEEYKTSNSTEKFVNSELNGKPRRICFHEIGKEIDEKYYGTSINHIVNSLMMRRYEIFQKYGTVTHVTSNFHPNSLNCFDSAVIDRMKEMFNFVEWHGGSLRK